MNAHDIQEWIDHLNDEATESYINTVVLTKNDGSGNRRDNLKVTFDTKKANKIFTNHITPIEKKYILETLQDIQLELIHTHILATKHLLPQRKHIIDEIFTGISNADLRLQTINEIIQETINKEEE